MTAQPSVTPLYRLLACRIQQAQGTDRTPPEIETRNREEMEELVKEFMPSGSGFDAGTKLDLDECRHGHKLAFTTSFHHMGEHGTYDGWTEHKVTIFAIFGGFEIKVSGRDRNSIKDYIAEAFESALNSPIAHAWTGDGFEFRYHTVK